jgi:hypothetical protein
LATVVGYYLPHHPSQPVLMTSFLQPKSLQKVEACPARSRGLSCVVTVIITQGGHGVLA